MKETHAVYKINIGPYYYIGSSVRFYKRQMEHKAKLNGNTHPNKFMQSAYNSRNKITFEIIEKPEKDKLRSVEQEHIDAHFNDPLCMNLSPSATSNVLSYEERKKLSQRNRDRLWTKEMRERMSKKIYGRKMPIEFKRAAKERILGFRNPNSKLSPKQVEEIKKRRLKGDMIKDIAEDYGVSACTIGRHVKDLNLKCRHPKTWTKAMRKAQSKRDGHTYTRDVSGVKNPRAKLNIDDVGEIKYRLSNGESCVSISKSYPVGSGTIQAIKHGRIWKDC